MTHQHHASPSKPLISADRPHGDTSRTPLQTIEPAHTLARRALLSQAAGAAGVLLWGCGPVGSQPPEDAGSASPSFAGDSLAAPAARTGRLRAAPATAASGPSDAAPPGEVCSLTADNIEGPFFAPGAPERASLVGPQTPGTRLTIAGRVLTTDCKVVRGARIEIWQADHRGAYDLKGYAFRATLHSDSQGSWRLDTIVPGHYKNGAVYRPAHIHAKLTAPGLRPLTTQLYLPDDPYNEGDPFIVSSLIMSTQSRDGGKWSSFDFVLEPNA